MADCSRHAGVEAAVRCAGCRKPYCDNCVVELRGETYCGPCKNRKVRERLFIPAYKKPAEALRYAIVGIVCCGIVLEPVAIYKACTALGEIRRNPLLPGKGMAIAALIIGIGVVGLWVLAILFHVFVAAVV